MGVGFIWKSEGRRSRNFVKIGRVRRGAFASMDANDFCVDFWRSQLDIKMSQGLTTKGFKIQKTF